MSSDLLRVLCIEDNHTDADLLLAHLEMRELNVHLHRVETEASLWAALRSNAWDIILADYSLPQFNANRALEIVKETGLDIPFIVVSGTIGEERAIEMMQGGANDFIVKGDYKRLVPAMRRELAEAVNRKARRDAEIALAQSEVSFKQLADSMPLLVWTASADGAILFANSRWYSYTGFSNIQTLGWEWTNIFAPAQRADAVASYKSLIAAGVEFSAEQCLRSADGQYRWFLTRATPAFNGAGQIERWYATSTDIHEQKQAAEELRFAKIAAEQANEAKSAFLANMSHEIRTPLGAILGFADLMSDEGQSVSDRQDCISTIKRNGEQLSRLINEILDLSKVESDRLEVEMVEFDITELVGDVTSFLSVAAQQKGLKVTADIDGRFPRTVRTDPTRLRQILINVLGNAIKFTESGSVTLRAMSQMSSAKPGEAILEFEVTDTGVGLDNNQRRRLFQPFMQGDASMTRKHGGTGLGLALSRRLAEALGGTIELKRSEPGKGSTFACRIKAIVSSQADIRSTSSQAQPQVAQAAKVGSDSLALAGKRVLLVEDAPDNRILISRYLTKVGAQVDSEENGQLGAKRALTESYDVVLMDIQMPVMDGFSALALLRDSGYQGFVVALTAHAMTGYRERCLEAGFNEHLSKPIDKTLLIELVKKTKKVEL